MSRFYRTKIASTLRQDYNNLLINIKIIKLWKDIENLSSTHKIVHLTHLINIMSQFQNTSKDLNAVLLRQWQKRPVMQTILGVLQKQILHSFLDGDFQNTEVVLSSLFSSGGSVRFYLNIPLASTMPVAMASLFLCASVNPLRNKRI